MEDNRDQPKKPGRCLPPPTLKRVTGELWTLYREARKGLVDIQDASRLATILNVLLSGIKSTDLEARIEGLEGIANKTGR
jgi:hypothetical protein